MQVVRKTQKNQLILKRFLQKLIQKNAVKATNSSSSAGSEKRASVRGNSKDKGRKSTFEEVRAR
jgi:hypothetical protein